MAYIPEDPNDPNNPQNQQQMPMGGAPGEAGPQTSTGDVASTNAGPNGPTASNQSKQPAFQNLGAYLTANAPQAQEMGQKVATGLDAQRQGVQSAIDQATGQFNQQVQAGTTNLNQGLLDQALSNPTQAVQDPNNVNEFQKMLNAQYTGPQNINQTEGYSGLGAQVQNALQISQNAGNPTGLETIVGSQQKNTNRGKQGLDALLLQQNPGAQSAIKASAQNLGSLGDYLGQQTQTANDAAKQAADITAATRAATQGAVDTSLGQFDQDLAGRLNQATTDRTNYNQSLMDEQSKANSAMQAAQSYAARYGLNPDVSGLQGFVGQGAIENAPVRESIASADEFAKEAALEQLLGSGLGILNNDQSGMAGSFNVPGLTGSQDMVQNLVNDLYGQANAYTDPYRTAKTQFDQNYNAHRAVVDQLNQLQQIPDTQKTPEQKAEFARLRNLAINQSRDLMTESKKMQSLGWNLPNYGGMSKDLPALLSQLQSSYGNLAGGDIAAVPKTGLYMQRDGKGDNAITEFLKYSD